MFYNLILNNNLFLNENLKIYLYCHNPSKITSTKEAKIEEFPFQQFNSTLIDSWEVFLEAWE